jgi:NAD(P)H-hydrate epimerase
VPVKVFVFSKRTAIKGDPKIFLDILEKMNVTVDFFEAVGPEILAKEFLSAAWIVDALFGTGLEGTVTEPYATVIHAINESSATVLSVDIPSGMDCDSGEELGVAVRADHTVTFVGVKVGFKNPKAKFWLGKTKVIDIGITIRDDGSELA